MLTEIGFCLYSWNEHRQMFNYTESVMGAITMSQNNWTWTIIKYGQYILAVDNDITCIKHERKRQSSGLEYTTDYPLVSGTASQNCIWNYIWNYLWNGINQSYIQFGQKRCELFPNSFTGSPTKENKY